MLLAGAGAVLVALLWLFLLLRPGMLLGPGSGQVLPRDRAAITSTICITPQDSVGTPAPAPAQKRALRSWVALEMLLFFGGEVAFRSFRFLDTLPPCAYT